MNIDNSRTSTPLQTDTILLIIWDMENEIFYFHVGLKDNLCVRAVLPPSRIEYNF